MSNYDSSNLISIPASSVPAGTLAMKIGSDVFTAGAVVISGGTDVSSTTAQAADVLSGKVFYNSGGVKTSGTIQTVSAAVVSGAVVIPAGYIANSQSFPVSSGVDVSSTTAEASDVLSGKIFYTSGGTQTSGTIQTVSASVSGGSVIVPIGYIASSQSFPVSSGGTDFYKCATVDTVNLTWTGYKAVFDSVTGTYGYEVIATTGLTYSTVTPVAGKVYADGALIEAKLYEGIPLSGLLLYAPLKTQQAAAETGQAITYENPAFTTYQGIECMQCQGNTYATIAMQNIPQSDSPRTISFWAYATGDPSSVTFVSQGQDYENELINICLSMGNLAMNFSYNDHSSQYNPTGAWHHYAFTYDGSNAILYVDAEAKISAATTLDTNGTDLRIAYLGLSGYFNLTGYIAAVRVYDRALASSEIDALAVEFTPSVS